MPFRARVAGNPQDTRTLAGTVAPWLAKIGLIAEIKACSHDSRCSNVLGMSVLTCISRRVSPFKRPRRCGLFIHGRQVVVRRALARPAAMPARRHYFSTQRSV